MPQRIILLTGDVEAPHLTRFLCHYNAALQVDWVDSQPALIAAFDQGVANTRLIALLTDIIVPPTLLKALPGPAYNFHPGPPEYPGSYVAGFAIYEGAKTFGVTLHEMAEKVDAGAIVETRRFDIPEGAKFQDVELQAFNLVIELFKDHAAHLATNDAPLGLSDERWSEKMCTRANAEKLKQIESDLSEDEINRRYRAFG